MRNQRTLKNGLDFCFHFRHPLIATKEIPDEDPGQGRLAFLRLSHFDNWSPSRMKWPMVVGLVARAIWLSRNVNAAIVWQKEASFAMRHRLNV